MSPQPLVDAAYTVKVTAGGQLLYLHAPDEWFLTDTAELLIMSGYMGTCHKHNGAVANIFLRCRLRTEERGVLGRG